MLTKTNLKAIRLADQFVFVTENSKSYIRCIKKGSSYEDEPFAQPDVHHDIACDSKYPVGNEAMHVIIESDNEAVVSTVLNGLKEADEINLVWGPLNEAMDRFVLSMNIERKGKLIQYILAVQGMADGLRVAA